MVPSPGGGEIGFTDFAGISNIDEVTDTTVLIHWDYHAQVSAYFIYKKELAPQTEEFYQVAAVALPNQTSVLLTGLNTSTSYSFMVHAYDLQGRIDSNEVALSAQTLGAPRAPSSVMLKNPPVSPGFIRAPVVTVRYVKPGETVKIFSDASCTQLLGQAVVGNDKTSVDVQSSSLSAGQAYTVYANTTSTYGQTSACSTAHASYLVKSCPDDSYAAVEGNNELGSDAFCVFKTEAKNNGAGVPISAYEGISWGNITAGNAKTACQSISLEGGTSDLISNIEWMTIAWDIEATAANWSGGEVGNGKLNTGHSDNNPSSILSISDPTNPWDQTNNNSSDWSQKRTFVLNSGEVIWDLAGNINEWVDWERGGATYTKGPTTCAHDDWEELYPFECEDIPPQTYLPGNPANIPFADYTSENYGLGKVYSAGTYGGVLRGGKYDHSTSAGIFSVHFNNNTAAPYNFKGFRCVWRPE